MAACLVDFSQHVLVKVCATVGAPQVPLELVYGHGFVDPGVVLVVLVGVQHGHVCVTHQSDRHWSDYQYYQDYQYYITY